MGVDESSGESFLFKIQSRKPWDGGFWEVRVSIEFKPRDCWIGAYWTRNKSGRIRNTHTWICVVPMLPIHVHLFRVIRRDRGQEEAGKEKYTQGESA